MSHPLTILMIIPILLLIDFCLVIVPKKVTFSDEEKKQQADWEMLCKQECPECHKHETIVQTAQGGCALNLECTACNTRFWHGGPMPVAYVIPAR